MARSIGTPVRNVVPFSEALEKTGFGIFNYFLMFIGGLAFINTMLETASISFILPVAECDLEMTTEDKGILGVIGYIGMISSSHLWGFLADTKGRRAVIMPSIFISFAVSVVSSFANSFWLFVFLRFVNGFFICCVSSTTFAYVGEFHTDRARSTTLIFSSFIYAIGSMLLPVAAWGIINQSWSLPMPFLGIVYKPWRLFVVACGSVGLVSGIALFFYPETPKFLLSIGKEKEAIEVLKRMHKWNVGHGELNIDGIIPDKDITGRILRDSTSERRWFLVELLQTIWNQTAPLFQRDFLRSTLIICTSEFWIYVSFFGMYMWIPQMLDEIMEFMKDSSRSNTPVCDIVFTKEPEDFSRNDTMHCNEWLEDRTYLYSLFMEIVFSVTIAIIGFIIRRVRKYLILFVLLVVFGLSGVLTVIVHNTWVAMALYLLLYVAGVGGPVLSAITIDLYPTHLRGMALSVSLMCARLGGVFGMNIIGSLLSNDCKMAFYISGVSLIICGFLSLLLPKEFSFRDDKNNDP